MILIPLIARIHRISNVHCGDLIEAVLNFGPPKPAPSTLSTHYDWTRVRSRSVAWKPGVFRQWIEQPLMAVGG